MTKPRSGLSNPMQARRAMITRSTAAQLRGGACGATGFRARVPDLAPSFESHQSWHYRAPARRTFCPR
jgi:hypothetical protein